MKPDEFEETLQRQPLRPIPQGWRAEILRNAQAAAGSRLPTLDTRPSLLSILNSQLSALLWPSPRAWAGLAAVWVAILAMNLAARDKSPTIAKDVTPPSPEMIMALRQQERLLAELVERPEPRETERSKAVPPRPRSERRDELLMA